MREPVGVDDAGTAVRLLPGELGQRGERSRSAAGSGAHEQPRCHRAGSVSSSIRINCDVHQKRRKYRTRLSIIVTSLTEQESHAPRHASIQITRTQGVKCTYIGKKNVLVFYENIFTFGMEILRSDYMTLIEDKLLAISTFYI